MTVAARATKRKLEITPQGGSLRVTNQLGAPVKLLVLRNKDGRLYVSQSVDAGQRVVLTPVVDESKLARRLRTIFLHFEPRLPEGFESRPGASQYSGLAAQRYGYNAYDYYGGGGEGLTATSRLEQRLSSFKQAVGGQAGRSVNLRNGAYLAIMSEAVEVATGLEDPQEEASFHVVEGQW
jgi:hypothetical protein